MCDDEYDLDADDAADFLGVSWELLEEWRQRGEGPKFIERNGCVYYHSQSFDEFLDKWSLKETRGFMDYDKMSSSVHGQKTRPQ